MRVDPYYVSNLATALDQTQTNQENLSQEISTGLAYSQIGQNPVAAAKNVQMLNEISQDDSFTQTANITEGMLNVTDSALGSVVSQLNEAVSLATQANNGTLNSSNSISISTQLEGIRAEVLSLANTTYQGAYVFGGSQTGSAPFTLDTTTSPATVTYNGDSDVNTLVSPSGQGIQLNVPGNQIFTAAGSSVLDALSNLIADYANGSTGAGASDISALTNSLNYVSQQRVTIDNSISRLTNASSVASEHETQITAAQTNLMQTDIAQVSTQLSLSKSQETALDDMIAALGSGSLFDKL